jgi:DNA-directed RNA polymerase subunit RPC12/RpoP
MLEMFDTFTTLFFIGFFLILGFIIFMVIASFMRALRGKNEILNLPTTAQNEPVVTQKEIIHEVVKIRCPYCHGLYDETLDKCPNCGAKNS